MFLHSALHLLHTLRPHCLDLYINPAMSMTILMLIVYKRRMLMMNAVLSQHVDGTSPDPILPIPTSDLGWPTLYGFFIT